MRKTYTHDSCRILTHHLIVRETKSQRLGLYFFTSQRFLWAAVKLSRQASLDAVISSGVAPFFVGFSRICSAVWATTPCNVLRESFEGKCCFNLQVRRESLWQGLWKLWHLYSTSTAYLSPTLKRLRFPFIATDGLVVCLRLRRVQFALLCIHSKSPEARLCSSTSVSVLINRSSSRDFSVYPIYWGFYTLH
jgi:hypothetical protein